MLQQFVCITVIECFLHAFLKIQNVATNKTRAVFHVIADKVWRVYEAQTLASFSQRMRRLKEWGEKLSDSALQKNLLKLCAKKERFTSYYGNRSGCQVLPFGAHVWRILA